MNYHQIKTVPIDDIKPYANNAKSHPQKQIDLLVKQISEGFDQPIVVDKNMVIIKGHGRRLAALQMGLKTVPVIVRDDLTPQQVKAARIADNKLAETDWDMELLAQELEALDMGGYDLDDLGFDDSELESLMGVGDSDGELDNESSEPDYLDDDSDYDEVPQSSVRMVQLFLDTKTQPLFIEMTEKLETIYGTDNSTDTVMAGLAELCENHSISLENG